MRAALYSVEQAHFIRLGNGVVIGWYREGEEWLKGRCELPNGAEQIGFADLPEELREEVLAVLAQAEGVRGMMG